MTLEEFETDLPMLRRQCENAAKRWMYRHVDRQFINDVVQDALLILSENLDKRERWSVKYYLRAVVRNICMYAYRKRLNQPCSLSAIENIQHDPIHPDLIVPSEEERYLERFEMSDIAEAFYSLSPKSQRILLAEFVERVGQEEHADRIGVTSRTLRNWKTRALKEIKAAYCPGETQKSREWTNTRNRAETLLRWSSGSTEA